ncbi:MAG: hypothetical protein ACRBB4_04875, partial [Neptuniibacter sp.]
QPLNPYTQNVLSGAEPKIEYSCCLKKRELMLGSRYELSSNLSVLTGTSLIPYSGISRIRHRKRNLGA